MESRLGHEKLHDKQQPTNNMQWHMRDAKNVKITTAQHPQTLQPNHSDEAQAIYNQHAFVYLLYLRTFQGIMVQLAVRDGTVASRNFAFMTSGAGRSTSPSGWW